MNGSVACCCLANLPPPHLVCSEKFSTSLEMSNPPDSDKAPDDFEFDSIDDLKGEQLRKLAGQAADKLGVADGQFTFLSGRVHFLDPPVSRVG